MSDAAPSWEFVPLRPMSKQRDPVQGEFFNTESITTTADEVVRESFQNALDAAAGDAVRVRLFVSGSEGAVPNSEAAEYFEGLWEHVTASNPDAPLDDQPCHFVVVEDFGTTGLIGDEKTYEAPVDGTVNHFFYFFRAEGKSGKSGHDRGRWGVGKYVFPKASRANTFLAMTVRADGPGAPGPLLMGQAVLRNHVLNGTTYEPDGWWATYENEVPIPATDADAIARFRETWEVERTDEPGLSVVIPYVHGDLDDTQLRRSVVRDYFVAILSKTLTVDIATADGNVVTVDDTSLDEVIDSLGPTDREEVRRNVDLLRWALGPTANVIEIEPPFGQPQWVSGLIPDEARMKIRAALEAEQSVVVRVPVKIKTRVDGNVCDSSFDVLFSPEPAHRRPPMFVREGIIVSEVKSRAIAGIRVAVVASGGAMADLLGDAEGPAHTNWSEKTDRFKGKYRYGPNWISFVRQAPSRIVDIVRGADDEEDKRLAADFFYVPTDADGSANTELDPQPETDDSPVGTRDIPPGSPAKVRVTKASSAGGFSVRTTAAGADVVEVALQIAYDRSRGNPFSKWTKDDFDLATLTTNITGGTITSTDGYRLKATVTDPASFHLQVTGFDTNRDIVVRASGTVAP